MNIKKLKQVGLAVAITVAILASGVGVAVLGVMFPMVALCTGGLLVFCCLVAISYAALEVDK